jgi:hypothetical protein
MERENAKKLPTDLELWVDVIGYKGEYQLSNKGRLRSPERVVFYKNGRKRTYPYREQTVFINTSGYPSVGLSKNKKQRQWLLHRLLAIHFKPNPDNKPFINHINGVKTDFSLSNIEWCTHVENCKHAFSIGLSDIHGERHPIAKLNNDAVYDIRKNCKDTSNAKEYATKYGVNPATIKDVIWRRTWTHI